MTQHRICPTCGALYTGVAHCARASEQRRLQRRRSSGRNLATWRKLVTLAIARDECCQICGATEDLTGGHLVYPAVTVDDVQTQCRSCNGRLGAQAQAQATA